MLLAATIRNVRRAFKEVNGFEIEGDYRPAARMALKQVLETALEGEVSRYVAAERYERVDRRQAYRCGYYVRWLLTEVGDLLLKVPRIRSGGLVFRTLEAYARRPKVIDQLILSCFVLGMSTRKVACALGAFLGSAISAQTISRIAQQLDRAVSAFHRRSLLTRYRYLLLDGVMLKHRGALAVRRRVLLCAYGITQAGVREFIDFMLAPSESAAAWEAFLRDLYERGLSADSVQLIVTDGGRGLHQALEMIWPRIPRQRCWAHKIRNVLDKVKKADWEVVKRSLGAISHAVSRREAIEAFWRFAQHHRGIYPKAVACIQQDLDDLLSFLDCPKEHWARLRTTNAIERAFREVRRRTRPIGVFTNSQSLERIVYAVMHHLNETWKEIPLLEFAQRS
jgi:transposase-like protein